MSAAKKEAYNLISHLDELIEELVVDGTVQRNKLVDFASTLKGTSDALGLELDLHYGSEYEGMADMVESAFNASSVEYFEVDSADVNPAYLKERLVELRDMIQNDEDDDLIGEYICFFACVVGLWVCEHRADFNVPETFSFMDNENEDGNWVEDDSNTDGSVWEDM